MQSFTIPNWAMPIVFGLCLGSGTMYIGTQTAAAEDAAIDLTRELVGEVEEDLWENQTRIAVLETNYDNLKETTESTNKLVLKIAGKLGVTE